MSKVGEVYRVAGPVVTATGISPRMYEVAYVGEQKLMGEVIQIVGQKTIIQVYEDTSGIKPGEVVEASGLPLTVELGPGLLGSIYDGIQRPLPIIRAKRGDFIERGVTAEPLPRDRRWEFQPLVKPGDRVERGNVLGTVQEAKNVSHRVLVPPNISGGTIKELRAGKFTVDEVIGCLTDGTELKLMHRWPVREARPFNCRLMPNVPLLTGQRVFDTMFPVAKGGTAAIPGGFGTGKTVSEHQFAKWCDAEVVVYIGCGERGNEMTEVLTEFPHLTDPKTGEPLMKRTVLIANTSNMPVAAREASIYTGITIAEYYRDMGYSVALMADSTSRWAEAMREISSRLEEMPGEEGYPAYLSAKLSAFYERAGRVITLNNTEGAVTIVGAVSPPGGDFSEPVTQATLRIVKVFWALDMKLRERRHFPSVNWLLSYSLYTTGLEEWFKKDVSPEFPELRRWAMAVLQKEDELKEIVQLVGSDALPPEQQLILEIARMIREFFLQQNAFHEVDTYCPLPRQYELLKAIKKYSDLAHRALQSDVPLQDIVGLPSKDELGKVKFEPKFEEEIVKIVAQMDDEFKNLGI